MSKEIETKIDGFMETVKTFNDEYHEKQNGMNDNLAELSEKSAGMLEEINQLKFEAAQKAEQEKAYDEKIEALEKAAYAKGEKNVDGEAINKNFSNQFSRYLKKGVAMDEKTVEIACDAIVDMKMKGLTEEEATVFRKDLQVQSNPDGGYWVVPEMLGERVKRIFETSPMRQLASIRTTSSESVEMIIDDNEADSGGWVSETAPRPTTGTPQIGKLTIHTHEQYANPKATQKMLDDAGFDIEAWLNEKVASKFTRVENTAFVSGDGADKPKGFLDYAAWAAAGTYERDALERVNSQSASDFTYNGIVALQNAVIDEYQSNATFMLKRASWLNVLTLVDLNDRPLINMDLLRVGADKILLGKNVVFANDMPAITGGAESLAYGDFREGYQIVDRIGIRVLRDPYTAKPYIQYYTTKRVGGAVKNYEAIKIQPIAV